MAYAIQRSRKNGLRFTGVYIDPDGMKRSAGTFSTRREAVRAAHRDEQLVLQGRWHDAALGAITFHDFVAKDWLPSKHFEATTRAAYVSNLNKHFYPFFGKKPIAKITPSLVQDWVTKPSADGLSPRSIRKYHRMRHSIFKRAAWKVTSDAYFRTQGADATVASRRSSLQSRRYRPGHGDARPPPGDIRQRGQRCLRLPRG